MTVASPMNGSRWVWSALAVLSLAVGAATHSAVGVVLFVIGVVLAIGWLAFVLEATFKITDDWGGDWEGDE